MPDINITNDSTIGNRRPRRTRIIKDQPLLTYEQIRELADAVQKARTDYREEDEAQCISVYNTALDRIADARTVDPVGIALKLATVMQYRDDASLLSSLSNGRPLDRAIAGIIRDVRAATPTPPATPKAEALALRRSPTAFARDLALAAQPHIEQGGGILDGHRQSLVAALTPMIGHYTIADAVATIGALRTTAEVIRGDEAIDDGIYAVVEILEKFCSYADAADAESVAARAYLIQMASSDDAWDLCDATENITKAASWDIRSLRAGKFADDNRGVTFCSAPLYARGWLYHVISDYEGVTAATEYSLSVRQEQPMEAVGA